MEALPVPTTSPLMPTPLVASTINQLEADKLKPLEKGSQLQSVLKTNFFCFISSFQNLYPAKNPKQFWAQVICNEVPLNSTCPLSSCRHVHFPNFPNLPLVLCVCSLDLELLSFLCFEKPARLFRFDLNLQSVH